MLLKTKAFNNKSDPVNLVHWKNVTSLLQRNNLGQKTAYENWVTAPNKQLICGARIKDTKVNVIFFGY